MSVISRYFQRTTTNTDLVGLPTESMVFVLTWGKRMTCFLVHLPEAVSIPDPRNIAKV